MKKLIRQKEVKNLCGARIREAREIKAQKENCKFTIVSLAAALAVDYEIEMDTSTLSRIERQQRLVSDKELYAISQILGVRIDWLLTGKGKPELEPVPT